MSNDAEATFAKLKERILLFSDEREWGKIHSPKNLSMALASEAAELMELFLWVDSKDSQSLIDDPVKGPRIREELADILIYALEFSNRTGIDVSQAIEEKIAVNGRKYPADKFRGSSKKYYEA